MRKKANLKIEKQPVQNVKYKDYLKSDKLTILILLVILVSSTIILFSPGLKNNFINWDDDLYVLNNALLRGPDWAAIFTKPVAYNYHPLTILSLALNYAISGTEAWSYLFINLVLHTVNALLVFKFIYTISNQKHWVAFFTALVFAIHPMHVESVAWVSERKDVLYTLFFLLSLIQYWKYLQTSKQKWLWVCFLFFVLSLLSKPAAIMLPFVLLLLDYWKQRTFHKKIFIEKIPFLFLSGLFAIITVHVQAETAIISLDAQPLWARFFLACYSLMFYFIRFFVPYPLSAYHPFRPVSNLGIDVYLSPVFILVLLSAAWYLRKNRVFIFGILFFVINLLLVIQIVTIGSTLVADRYTYVPYIGLSLIVAMWLDSVKGFKKIKWAILSVAALVFAGITFQRIKVWQDSDVFWTTVINRHPAAPLPRNQRAIYYAQMAESLTDPAQVRSLLEKALEDCNVELRFKPNYTVALQNRQRILLNLERNDEALTDAELLMKLDPANYMAYYTKGMVYLRRINTDSAVPAFKKCVSLNPGYDEAWDKLGNIMMRKYRQFNEALDYFNRAIALSPKAMYFANRSICYYNLGEKENAKRDVLIALQNGVVVPDDFQKALGLK
jgi:tetratricopeptide (TPR) repeat protein